MSFGGGTSQGRDRTGAGKGPAYTPTRADPSVITAGLTALTQSNLPEFSTSFKSLIGGAGGLGRKPSLAKRSLLGGA